MIKNAKKKNRSLILKKKKFINKFLLKIDKYRIIIKTLKKIHIPPKTGTDFL